MARALFFFSLPKKARSAQILAQKAKQYEQMQAAAMAGGGGGAGPLNDAQEENCMVDFEGKMLEQVVAQQQQQQQHVPPHHQQQQQQYESYHHNGGGSGGGSRGDGGRASGSGGGGDPDEMVKFNCGAVSIFIETAAPTTRFAWSLPSERESKREREREASNRASHSLLLLFSFIFFITNVHNCDDSYGDAFAHTGIVCRFFWT